MVLSTDHYLELKSGIFDGTTTENLDDLFQAYAAYAADSEHNSLVIHFHGGLVNANAAMASAEELMGAFSDLDAYQVFFIWESGLMDAISEKLNSIFNEDIFQQLLTRITQFAIAKLNQSDAERGISLRLPGGREIQQELHQLMHGQEPFATVRPAELLPPGEQLQEAEANRFREALAMDYILGKQIQTIADAVPVLSQVIERFANRRDHGVYATVIEEILRQFYFADIGEDIWDQMKDDTITAFNDDPQQYGGTRFLKNLNEYYANEQHPRPHITLVGHSAGAIYICHFLENADKSLPPEVTFDVVFLAPACTFDLFSDTYDKYKHRIAEMRVFGMSDELERADYLPPADTGSPPLYPRSLLYFISGVLEKDADTSLVGMQRYYFDAVRYGIPQDCLNYVLNRTVWSKVNGGNGRSSGATTHSGFYTDPLTRNSLRYIIANGL